MLNLQLPEPTDYHASVFDQAGKFVMVGTDEACEEEAKELGGLYCWNINGKPVIRNDFDFGDTTEDPYAFPHIAPDGLQK